MKAIILAGGFATRLYPLTLNKAKPLLEIKGRKIIDYTVSKIREIPDMEQIIVSTNHKFYNDFLEWGKNKNVLICDNGISSEEEKQQRSGTIPDLMDIINEQKIDDNLLVIAGDTLFRSSLLELYKTFKAENKDLCLFHDIKDIEPAKRLGVGIVKDNLLIDFEEKPKNPKSTLVAVPIYFYKKETIPIMRQFLKESINRDPPGRFLEYLIKKVPIYVDTNEKDYIDIGSFELWEKAQSFFD